jgi:hypoxanthine phosphoribosyltransferase
MTYSRTIPELLKDIKTEKDATSFKESMLGLIQLYYDGLVEKEECSKSSQVWTKQKETLDELLRGVQLTVARFYQANKNIPFLQVKKIVLPLEERLIKYGSKKSSKTRHLSLCENQVRDYATDIIPLLENEKIDTIIPVASGGFEPAVLAADYLGITNIFPVRYSILSREDTRVNLAHHAPRKYTYKQITDKKVLIIEDIIYSGETIGEIISWTEKFRPAKVYVGIVQEGEHRIYRTNFFLNPNSSNLYEESSKIK